MKISDTEISDVKLIEPIVHGDERGYFFETWSEQRYAAAGIGGPWVQDNVSRSRQNIVRGLHFQHPNAQAKLVFVLEGNVLDVAVDVRVGSPTFGKAVAYELSSSNKRQLYIPAGFAHGFAVISPDALFAYKCSERYSPTDEFGIAWDDPALGIPWPTRDAILSDKDRRWPRLADAPPDRLPTYAGARRA